MSLGRIKTWVAGELLRAADLNGEFNNILNNPISLVSPTTGAINFNAQAHTGLVPQAITGTSGTAGQVLTITSSAGSWVSSTTISISPGSFTTMSSGQLLIGTSSGAVKSLVIGSTGQVLSVSSSNSDPVWGVIPPSGGLTTGTLSTGGTFYLSTAHAVAVLPIGTSGQVLTVSTALLPSWVTPAASGSGGSRDPNVWEFYEDFTNVLTTAYNTVSTATTAQGSFVTLNNHTVYNLGTTGSWELDGNTNLGIISLHSNTTPIAMALTGSVSPTNTEFYTTGKINFTVRYRQHSTVNVQRIIGFTTGSFSTAPTHGIFLLSTAGSTTVTLVVKSGAVGSTTLSAGVTASSFHTYNLVITSSSVALTVDGAAVGTVSNFVSTGAMRPIAGSENNAAPAGLTLDYVSIVTSGRSVT